ncbi:Serine/threonine-protein kinase Sgk1 [Blomia tropicalis]|nr:Serine/threonine-protein kinase Sgk1 [Blomia tropicalis]
MALVANVVSSEVWEQNKKYTVYKIVVKYDDQNWTIHRRYNEFSKLCDGLKKLFPHLHLKLPGKKLFGNNFSTDFIRSRRQGLDNLVQRMLSDSQVLNVRDNAEMYDNILHKPVRFRANMSSAARNILESKDNFDMKNIDPEFIRESIPNSVIKSQGMGASSLGDNTFQGFSYAPGPHF